jgi:diguanylate cyclase (GGDEF)-like protein
VPLRLLLVEDSELDAALLLRELRRAGFEPEHRRVDSAAGVREALNGQHWDLVIADHNMPQFSSEEALALVHAADPDAPFIIVSGSIGEDVAVAAMKSGAHDYIMKDNLARLVPAIERELRETQYRRAQRAAEETIRHLAFHDSLTGLINRNEFEQRLEGALRLAAGTEEHHVLLYIDLDQFKVINDTCGHAAGDELLRRLAQVLQHKVRASDSLARLGGDEFGALLAGCRVEDGRHIADNLLNAIQAFRFHWEGKTFSIGASIGLVPMGSDTATATEVLRLADLACYAAKDLGRNRVLVYEPNDSALTLRQGEMRWVSRLGEAIERDELTFHFQPIAPLSDRAEGFHYELLLRLQQPDGELIGPSLFIPAAERYSLMPRLDRWVITRGLRRLAQLAQQGELRPGTTFFMNLSGTSLSDDALPRFIREQLAELSVPPWAVGFELTETAAITHFDNALALIDAVRTLGCRVALDDFGTGMASFTYLKAMKVDHLKIDGSFVRTILEDPMDAAVVEAITHVAQVAGVQTIAECVETEPILRKLQALGVDYAQGFAVVRPGPWAQWPPASASMASVLPS